MKEKETILLQMNYICTKIFYLIFSKVFWGNFKHFVESLNHINLVGYIPKKYPIVQGVICNYNFSSVNINDFLFLVEFTKKTFFSWVYNCLGTFLGNLQLRILKIQITTFYIQWVGCDVTVIPSQQVCKKKKKSSAYLS